MAQGTVKWFSQEKGFGSVVQSQPYPAARMQALTSNHSSLSRDTLGRWTCYGHCVQARSPKT